MNISDVELLRAALDGWTYRRSIIDAQIAEIVERLAAIDKNKGNKQSRQPAAAARPGGKQKRVLSPAARARIAKAQRKRWRNERAAKAAASLKAVA